MARWVIASSRSYSDGPGPVRESSGQYNKGMWVGVTERFKQFTRALTLTEAQTTDGATKHRGVRNCLNRHYYGSDSETDNSFLVGSWGKYTRVRPPRDIDLYFVLPTSVYHRYQEVKGNKQSILLQEVKAVLEKTYPSTKMRGDGQVVVVDFATFPVEVAPVFELDTGRYYFCNTHDGGSYQVSDPEAERLALNTINEANNKNAKTLIRMMKAWQYNCNVPLKSVEIELLVSEFIQQSDWRLQGWYFYDWLIRDFFLFLKSKANGFVYLPGTNKSLFLWDDWLSKCESAYARALKACEYEHDDMVYSAGEEWQKIFGSQIPQGV